MVELKFDIIKPNLYIFNGDIYFGIDPVDFIPVSRSVSESIGNHIGVLKVKEADLEVAKSGKGKSGGNTYSVPLTKYLDVIDKEAEYPRLGEDIEMTTNGAKLFNLGYTIDAQTVESVQDIGTWMVLKRDLANPNETFDRYDKTNLIYRLDREKTLEEMRRLLEELDPKIPDNYAELSIVAGMIPSSKQGIKSQDFGRIRLIQLKAKDRTKIEEAKADLVERLKEVDGPCLSFDAPQIYEQMQRLYEDAPELIQKYGDILISPNWKTRVFRLDP